MTAATNPGFAVECFDVGGTHVRGAVVTATGIERKIVERSERGDPLRLLAQIQRISARLDARGTAAVALCCPGPVTGTVMRGSRPLEIESDVDFAEGLRGMSAGRAVSVGNDLAFAARAELYRGEARSRRDFALLSLSTGIGVAVVRDGALVEHRVELGHSVLELDPAAANPCQGHAGCWVAQAAGAGIEATLRRAGREPSPVRFFESPDPALLARFKRYNAQGIGNLINAFDPGLILVMGSVGRLQFERVIPKPAELEAFTVLRPIPPIALASFDDDIGLYGGYEAAREGASRTA